jgi:DNA end-binding protein Ku
MAPGGIAALAGRPIGTHSPGVAKEEMEEGQGGKRRPIWSGALSFGLVNVPVRLFSATASHDVRFHEYQAKTGQRIHHKRVAEKSGREVPYQQIVKGYEVGRGKVVLLDPEEIQALEPRRSRTIEIEQFVDLAQIDPIVWDAPYYLGPGDETAAKSYELLRRAMLETNKVGVGRFVMRSKQYLITVRPLGRGLVLETMHFADEIRDQKEVTELPARVNVTARELGLARQLIEALSTEWDHSKFEDTFRDRVSALIEKKAKGQKIVAEEPAEEPGKVVDLMEALKASLQGGESHHSRNGSRPAAGGDGARKSHRRASTHRRRSRPSRAA